MAKHDERKFEDVVRSIANSEKDVDAILKAAKLNRHERPDNRLSAGQKVDLIESVILAGLPASLITAVVLIFIIILH